MNGGVVTHLQRIGHECMTNRHFPHPRHRLHKVAQIEQVQVVSGIDLQARRLRGQGGDFELRQHLVL